MGCSLVYWVRVRNNVAVDVNGFVLSVDAFHRQTSAKSDHGDALRLEVQSQLLNLRRVDAERLVRSRVVINAVEQEDHPRSGLNCVVRPALESGFLNCDTVFHARRCTVRCRRVARGAASECAGISRSLVSSDGLQEERLVCTTIARIVSAVIWYCWRWCALFVLE